MGQNNMVSAMSDLYGDGCYTEEADRDIFELQSQFETVLVLDAVEGTLDIISLCLFAFGIYNKAWETYTEGAHAFMFACFDVLIVTINVSVFVLPSYATFTGLYADANRLCFEGIPTPAPTFAPLGWAANATTGLPTFAPTESATDFARIDWALFAAILVSVCFLCALTLCLCRYRHRLIAVVNEKEKEKTPARNRRRTLRWRKREDQYTNIMKRKRLMHRKSSTRRKREDQYTNIRERERGPTVRSAVVFVDEDEDDLI